MARWEEAHDALVDAYRFAKSETGVLYIKGFADSFGKGGALGPAFTPEYLPTLLQNMLWNSDPVYIEPDMQTLWEAATTSFAAEPLHATDLITKHGFAYLPSPLEWTDIRGKMTSIRAFGWVEIKDGVLVTAYHRQGDIDDFDDGPPYVGVQGHVHVGDLLIGHLMPWRYGVDYFGSDGRPLDPEGLGGEPDIGAMDPRNLQRPVQCLWRLMQQTITTKVGQTPSKPFRRRAERANIPAKRVTVVTLRRPNTTEPGDEHHTVEWSHRWIVRGFWRNQWFSSIGQHRQVWINPYTKGPADLPLVVNKEWVYQLVQ